MCLLGSLLRAVRLTSGAQRMGIGISTYMDPIIRSDTTCIIRRAVMLYCCNTRLNFAADMVPVRHLCYGFRFRVITPHIHAHTRCTSTLKPLTALFHHAYHVARPWCIYIIAGSSHSRHVPIDRQHKHATVCSRLFGYYVILSGRLLFFPFRRHQCTCTRLSLARRGDRQEAQIQI